MKLITPESLAQSGSEDAHQLALMCWRASAIQEYPALKYLIHIPNGGFRDKREAAKLKAMGAKTGVSDLFLAKPFGRYAGLWVELKNLKFDKDRWLKDQPEQSQWLSDMTDNYYYACVCVGWENARNTIVAYMEGNL